MRNVTLDIEGMKCDGCASAVQSALSGVGEGVRRADVSLEEGEARVVVEDEVAVGELVTAVEDAGYGAAERG